MSLPQDVNNQNLNNNTNTNTNTNSNNNASQQSNDNTEPRVFSEDYVKALRSEAAENRVKTKNLEKKLKTVLGIKEDEAVEDWDTIITNYQSNIQKSQQEQLEKVKELLFQAELKKYEGQYNMKLVNKLLDKSKVTVDDDGNISGLQEALKELEKDFPEVIKNNNNNGGANPVLDNQKQKSTNVFDLITKIKTRK
jgi:hypothetical protein